MYCVLYLVWSINSLFIAFKNKLNIKKSYSCNTIREIQLKKLGSRKSKSDSKWYPFN